jgi:amino acid permease
LLKIKTTALIVALLYISVLFLGCSTTPHEEKGTETGQGSSTELKLTGEKVKVVHSF